MALGASLHPPCLLPHTIFLSFPHCEQLHSVSSFHISQGLKSPDSDLSFTVYKLLSFERLAFSSLSSQDNQCGLYSGKQLFFCLSYTASCSPCWPQTHYAAKDNLELPLLLPPPPSADVTGMYHLAWYIPYWALNPGRCAY